MVRLSKEVKELIVSEKLNGISNVKIAQKHSTSVCTVRRVLREKNVKVKNSVGGRPKAFNKRKKE